MVDVVGVLVVVICVSGGWGFGHSLQSI